MNNPQRALQFFNSYSSYIITTHEHPDADGIGAEIVLANALKAIGKQVRVINEETVQDRFAFIDPIGILERWDQSAHEQIVRGAGLIIVDTADKFNIGPSLERILDAAAEVFIIDHHEPPHGSEIEGYIDPSASSSSELAIEIAKVLGATLDIVSARAAYAGIMYDTGSFIYPKTSARTFRTAVELVEMGVVPAEIYRALYESYSIEALLLQQKVISTLELFDEGRIAFQTMLKSDIAETKALYADAEYLINIPLRSKKIEISILLKESEEGRLRCSLRSKGLVNVSQIAQSFGGGGHRTAAGFKCLKGLAETKDEVLQKVSAALNAAILGER